MRRYGTPPIRGQAYRERPGAYGILTGPRGLLLVETEEVLLPGGGIDPGESPVQALHREVMEETGWRVAAPRRVGAFQRYCYMPEYDMWARKICHIYTARALRRVADPIELDHRPFWADPRVALARLAVSGERAALARLLATG